MFDQQRQQLDARNAAMGLLTSGAGNQSTQALTGMQDATLSSDLMPLIQQGYQQNFQGDVGNANALNNARSQQTGILGGYGSQLIGGNINMGSQMQDQSFRGQLANQAADLSTQQFNANNYNNVLGQNVGYQNQFQNNQQGFGHQDYTNALQNLYGLGSQGLNTGGYILGQGMADMFNSQQNMQRTMLPYAQQQLVPRNA